MEPERLQFLNKDFYCSQEKAELMAPLFGGEAVYIHQGWYVKIPTSYGFIFLYNYPSHDEYILWQPQEERTYTIPLYGEEPDMKVFSRGPNRPDISSIFLRSYYDWKKTNTPRMAHEWATIMYNGLLGLGEKEKAEMVSNEFNLHAEPLNGT